MVDIARDPRWGRVMEGAGEDPYLGSLISAARVKGFQGTNLGDTNTLMACVKHFAAYGAAVGGRDYNSVDMSERQLWEIYLPPFKAAVDAGAASFMNSFNDINGIPAVANNYLQRTILKEKWELINHGYAKDAQEAALFSMNAGTDMDMESRAYKNNLAQLVKEGKINIALIDDAVKRILIKKFEMGLFDNPYKFSNNERETAAMNNPAHNAAARSMAAKSIVLLKNRNNILPLSKSLKKIAFVGPLVKSLLQNKGFWDVSIPTVDSNFIVSQWEGLQNKVGPGTSLLYAKGCEIEGDNKSGFSEAVAIANQADVVILSIGEKRDMSGEAKSRSNINIPGVQEELLQALLATGKPVVVLINAGRPLVFNYTAKNATAILYTWWLGSEAGNAIADVLFGDYNPSAKLPMTFPMSVGQIPIYYNHFNTGRPATDDNNHIYNSSYLDESIFPKFPFGFGLSYTTFAYSNLALSKNTMNMKDSIAVSFTLTNTGQHAGEEVVQLYLHNKRASVVMPVKALKDFQKIMLQPGESKKIKFNINKEKLSFYNANLKWDAEPTDFDLMIGSSSEDIRLKESFELKK
jgi:beta-glucosidase